MEPLVTPATAGPLVPAGVAAAIGAASPRAGAAIGAVFVCGEAADDDAAVLTATVPCVPAPAAAAGPTTEITGVCVADPAAAGDGKGGGGGCCR